jgi:hypothetical protein
MEPGGLDFDTIIRVIDEGSTPLIGLVAYYVYTVGKKLDSLHDDVNAFIRKLAELDKE